MGCRLGLVVLAVVCAFGQASAAQAGQNTDQPKVGRAELPDAPSAAEKSAALQDQQRRLNPHEVLADDPFVPITTRQKFGHFGRSLYAPHTFVSAGVSTTWSRITGDRAYCCGASAWGKQYGAAVADTETRGFFGYFLFPTLLREDPRYFPRRQGNVFGRLWYSGTRVFVIRKDWGAEGFNYSEFLGVAFTRALSNAYYPDARVGTWQTFSGILGMLGGDAGGNALTEFMPDLKRAFRRHAPKKVQEIEQKLPIPDITGPTQ